MFTFPPLNVNWTFRSDPPPPPLLNVHLKFCCPINHCIPVRILTCTFYVKMSPIYCFKTWYKLHTSNYALSYLHNCFFLSMLLIPYYTTVFRGQSQNRWYKTAMSAMLLNNILNLLASGIPFSTSRMRYSFVTLKARAFFFLFGDVKATYPVDICK